MAGYGPYPILSTREVAADIKHGQTISFSGFSPAGAAKAVPDALATYAREQHALGSPFQIRVLTGASSGHKVDEDLAATAVSLHGYVIILPPPFLIDFIDPFSYLGGLNFSL